MATTTSKLVYEIRNGPMKGQKQSVDIVVDLPSENGTAFALTGLVSGAGIVGNFIALGLYIKGVRGSSAAFGAVGRRLAALGRPNVAGSLAETGEAEIGAETALAGEEVVPVADAAALAAVDAGLIDAAAASSLVPGIGWCVSAGLFTVAAVVDVALWIHQNRSRGNLASVIFINAVPNTRLKITSAAWDDTLEIEGGESKEAIATDHAHSTMDEAGALSYTWRSTQSGKHGGTLGVEMAIDQNQSDKVVGDLVWWIDPDAAQGSQHECTLTASEGGELISAHCFRQPVQHGDDKHFVLLYLLVPSVQGAARVAKTVDVAKPLVADTMWAADTGSYSIGFYGEGWPYYPGRGAFRTGNQAYTLRDLTLAYRYGEGETAVQVRLCHDDGGKPGAVIEEFAADAPAQPPLTLVSARKPRLDANTLYWITIDLDRNSRHWWEGCGWAPPVEGTNSSGTVRLQVGGDPIA